MSELLSKSITNSYYNTGTTSTTKTSTIEFENNVTVSSLKITHAYSQTGYSGGNGSVLNSTLKFYDKNNTLLSTLIPPRIYNSGNNTSSYKTSDVTLDLKNVRRIVLTSTGRNVGGYCLHTVVVNYTNDFTSEMIKESVKKEVLNNELIKNHILTYDTSS